MKGRGTAAKVDPRYLQATREAVDDGWASEEEPAPLTTVTVEKPRTIINRNQSPDIPFEQSINPYRGCEHGCIYCYARPAHAYMDLSPGIDFESRLFAKPGAVELLKRELAKPGYVCKPIALGSNTDPYQPIEREWRITRGIIQILHDTRHPLMIVTKSSLIERDMDLLAPMAGQGLVEVFISVTTLDNRLAKRLEPRAAAPHRRLEAISKLNGAGIPTGVMFAPVIPALNDTEMEAVLEQGAAAGAKRAGYIMLRLPHEIKQLFKAWLALYAPLKANHVMNRVRDIRAGRENDPNYHTRMRGAGVYADMIEKRFRQACKKFNLNREEPQDLITEKFSPPQLPGTQQSLF